MQTKSLEQIQEERQNSLESSNQYSNKKYNCIAMRQYLSEQQSTDHLFPYQPSTKQDEDSILPPNNLK